MEDIVFRALRGQSGIYQMEGIDIELCHWCLEVFESVLKLLLVLEELDAGKGEVRVEAGVRVEAQLLAFAVYLLLDLIDDVVRLETDPDDSWISSVRESTYL